MKKEVYNLNKIIEVKKTLIKLEELLIKMEEQRNE